MNSNSNTTPVNVNWGEQKTKLKAKFPTLTDEDLKYENGKKEDMYKKLETKLGKTRVELDEVISSL